MGAVRAVRRDGYAVTIGAVTISAALMAVARERFIPDVIYVRGDLGWLVPLDRADAPGAWRDAVESADPIVTRAQFDPAVPEALRDAATGRGMAALSTNSAPWVVRVMLELLDLQPGMRVLEVGTGTGWNAALMAHLVGPGGAVTSVEVDGVLAGQARENLTAAGSAVRVVAGDGTAGHPAGAPYDRVTVTAAVHTVPWAWVEQTRPGGVVVVPWAPTFHPDCPIARLEVTADGTAQGRFHTPGWFMPMSGHQPPAAAHDQVHAMWDEAGRPACTRYGVTVAPSGQTIWLDTPTNSIVPLNERDEWTP